MLVLARCLSLFDLGSVGLATTATYVSHACPCPLLFGAVWDLPLQQFRLTMLVLARCLSLFDLGSVGLATTAIYVSHACPCPLLC